MAVLPILAPGENEKGMSSLCLDPMRMSSNHSSWSYATPHALQLDIGALNHPVGAIPEFESVAGLPHIK